MKVVILCVTILCIANVNCGLRSLEPSDGAALDRFLENEGTIDWALYFWAQAAQDLLVWSNANPGEFQQMLDNEIPNSYITPLWSFCKNKNDTVHIGQFKSLFKHIYGFGTPEEYISLVQHFVGTYWPTLDTDLNGLNFDEFKYLITMLAAIEATVYFQGYDYDSNGQLSGYEMKNFRTAQNAKWTEEGVNEDFLAALQQAIVHAQDDGDTSTMTMFELTKFILSEWVIRLV